MFNVLFCLYFIHIISAEIYIEIVFNTKDMANNFERFMILLRQLPSYRPEPISSSLKIGTSSVVSMGPGYYSKESFD